MQQYQDLTGNRLPAEIDDSKMDPMNLKDQVVEVDMTPQTFLQMKRLRIGNML